MREVKVYRWGAIEAQGDEPAGMGKILEEYGLFHQWGYEYEECGENAGNLSVGIIEMPDGTVRLYVPRFIEFVEPLYAAFYGGDEDV